MSHTQPAAPSTPSDIGTPRCTSSVESCCGPGNPCKELSMPTLADCPPNASREELSKWWKQKQMKFWKYKKLSSPEADEYQRKESAHVKQFISKKKGLEEEDNANNGDNGDDISILDEGDDAENSDNQGKRAKSKEQSKIR